MCRCAAAIARAVVAFLDAVLVGCFLSCFRPRPRPGPASSLRDGLVRRDQAAEVLRDDDDEPGLGRSGSSCEGLDDGGGIDEEELRREANYLKLCGTISETPAELQNESHEISLEYTDECNNMPTNATATRCTSLYKANSSEGCRCEKHNTMSPEPNIEDAQDLPGVKSDPHSAFLEKTQFLKCKHKLLDCNGSPFPTPSVLRDDMQTPGTIYTSHRGAPATGKRVRCRKQFIYPVLRPIENNLQRMELTEDTSPFLSSSFPKRRNVGEDFIKKPKEISSTSVAKPRLSKSSSFSSPVDHASYQEKEAQSKRQLGSAQPLDGGKLSKSNSDEKHAALSLSHWLKPSFTDIENQDLNWDVENPTPRLPKTWDGNGIPNTTTRYKEDQKVTWHATPFEERLLKVLSDEEVCPPRRVVRGKLFHLEEKAGVAEISDCNPNV